MAARKERESWIARGDRSHPNLVKLDSLDLSYPGHEEDVAKAEEAHMSLPMEFKSKLFEISEKQRMYEGDRSHPRLVALDELTLSYPCFKEDVARAEEYHVSLPDLFQGKLAGMKEKQRMFDGDRSHPNLVELDELQLTYPGYRKDVKEAEEIHTSKPFLFPDKLQEIKEKQRIHQGDRNHPRLQTLDKLHLTYPDWKQDKAKAEEYHIRFPELFLGKITGMKEKQKMHLGDRSHPNLVQLDNLQLTYPGWQQDFASAEKAHTHMPLDFNSKLFEIQQKQNIFVGDRSHPRLVHLDTLQLTYPGWQRDFSKAQEYHIRFPELFPGKIAGMKEKQRIYAGDTTSTPIDAQHGNSWEHLSNIYKDTDTTANKYSQTHTKPPQSNSQQLSECIVCLKEAKTHAFVPCGHLCVCHQCVPKLMSKKHCPLCRQKATQVIKVFFS